MFGFFVFFALSTRFLMAAAPTKYATEMKKPLTALVRLRVGAETITNPANPLKNSAALAVLSATDFIQTSSAAVCTCSQQVSYLDLSSINML
jgi:hypothetical protein